MTTKSHVAAIPICTSTPPNIEFVLRESKPRMAPPKKDEIVSGKGFPKCVIIYGIAIMKTVADPYLSFKLLYEKDKK